MIQISFTLAIQKYVNLDLKFLCKWLKANKISLNASKTELIIFRDPRRKSEHDLKIKIDGKKLFPTRFVKYLGVLIDCNLSWRARPRNGTQFQTCKSNRYDV